MKMAKLVSTRSSGRKINKPKEMYFQNCVLKATIMKYARAKRRPAQRVKKCREKKREMARMMMEEEVKKKLKEEEEKRKSKRRKGKGRTRKRRMRQWRKL